MDQPAVFLDRDGTIIEDRGHLRDPSQVTFLPKAFAALRRLDGRFVLFIVTNQSGIGEGHLRPEEARRVNDHVVKLLHREDIRIRAVYCCPHRRTDNCACIKPNPFFLQQAARGHNINLPRSFVVGDHPHDVEFAGRAGATGIYVLTGHGQKHRPELKAPCTVVPSLWEAAEWILRQGEQGT